MSAMCASRPALEDLNSYTVELVLMLGFLERAADGPSQLLHRWAGVDAPASPSIYLLLQRTATRDCWQQLFDHSISMPYLANWRMRLSRCWFQIFTWNCVIGCSWFSKFNRAINRIIRCCFLFFFLLMRAPAESWS